MQKLKYITTIFPLVSLILLQLPFGISVLSNRLVSRRNAVVDTLSSDYQLNSEPNGKYMEEGSTEKLENEINELQESLSIMTAAKSSALKSLKNTKLRKQKKLSEVGAYLNKLKDLQLELQGMIKDTDDDFTARYPNNVADARDTPHAVLTPEQKLNETRYLQTSGARQGLDCPYTCDPEFCTNKVEFDTQCYKINFRENSPENNRICTAFENSDTFECPAGYKRCAMISPDKASIFRLLVSKKTAPYDQPIVISGRNLNQCLRLYVIPKGTNCGDDGKSIEAAVKLSVDYMGMSGSPSMPIIEYLPNGKQTATFKSIEIFKEGILNICLLQFHQDINRNKLELLGSALIGVGNAIYDKDVLMSAEKARAA